MKNGTWLIENGKEVAAVRGADGKVTKVPAPTKESATKPKGEGK